tara:strand:+ start:60 stop:413 length:354 start_codon:yes stop_codon:yes gene_type:complete
MIKFVSDNEYGNLPGEHYSLLDKENEEVCKFGLVKQWEGCARAYFDFTSHSNSVAIARGIKRLLKERNPYYARIEATVRCDSEVDQRFATWLGFVTEGTMEGYDPVDHTSHLLMRYN